MKGVPLGTPLSVNKWVVRILLECILVFQSCHYLLTRSNLSHSTFGAWHAEKVSLSHFNAMIFHHKNTSIFVTDTTYLPDI